MKYSRAPKLAVVYAMVGLVLSCHVSGFTFRHKKKKTTTTVVKVYHEFLNSTTASPFLDILQTLGNDGLPKNVKN